MIIERLQVTVERCRHWNETPSILPVYEIAVKVSVNGGEYGLREAMTETDLYSFFEQIWARAGKAMLEQLRRGQGIDPRLTDR